MRIPVGNFGNQNQTVVGQQPVSTAGSQAIANATDNLGQSLGGIAAVEHQKQAELARAKSANALADHELKTKEIGFEIQQRVDTGQLKYQDAQAEYESRVNSLEVPQIDGADPVTRETFGASVKRTNELGGLQMRGFVAKQEQDDYKSQFAQFLDTQGKIAGMPGADIAAITATGEKTAAMMAEKAGLSAAETGKYIQNWKDSLWFNNAHEKAIAARNDMGALTALEKDLTATDGYYRGKLDTDKRDALLSQVTNQKIQLENKAMIQADRADARAQRTLYQIDQQIATGVPARADQWETWAGAMKGTTYEADFQQRLADEKQVQEVLRMPLDQQAQYVQQKQAELMQSGGDVHQIANVQRLQTAVTSNIKQLQEQPLLYAQARTGAPVAPLDINKMMTPGGGAELVAQLHDRVDTINALRQQYGGRVQMKPLLDEEAKTLGDVFSKLGAEQKVQTLQMLRDGVGAPVMVPMMQQVAKNDPLLAAASGLTAAQTTQGRNVARLALLGDQLLKSKQVTIPSDPKLNDAFQRYVGNAITTIPGKQSAMQVANAIYAQLNAEDGNFLTKDSTFNASTYERAIRLATGGIVDYNGSKILPVQYGGTAAETKTKLAAITPAQVKLWGGVQGMTDDQAAQFIRSAPLESVSFGRYRVRAGAGLLASPTGGAFEMVLK